MAQTLPSTKDLPAAPAPAPEKISGGHLVAKALKNEGVDTIFTLCGGHIIDIYDGCIDEYIKIYRRSPRAGWGGAHVLMAMRA